MSILPFAAYALAMSDICPITANGGSPDNYPLWTLAKKEVNTHRFSTLIAAQNVRDLLSSEDGLNQAVEWCKRTGITQIYLETFRDNYHADAGTIQRARERFLKEGFRVSGCVTTTRVGKPSTGWKNFTSCYTDLDTQANLKAIFEEAAQFDEIMIDDFWFTDCTCPACEMARQVRTVTVGKKTFPVAGDSWEDYRCELMLQLSRECVLGAAKKINPRVRLIIKYPQWYDNFHLRGYDVVRETRDFDRIWVGPETRDYQDLNWGGIVQYEAYFNMRWLGGIGGTKCGGGWYDPLGTTENTYIEQARQTVLAGAAESMLFCYGSLLINTGPKNIEALRAQQPELFAVAHEVRKRQVMGLAAYKPPNSSPGNDGFIFDYVGMLGLPLVPCHEFPQNAPAAFFSIHALKDTNLVAELNRFIKAGKPVLLTDGLKRQLESKIYLDVPNVFILPAINNPESLLQLTQSSLDSLRIHLLSPLKCNFAAPSKIGLYLFTDGSWVIENFNNLPVTVQLNGAKKNLSARSWMFEWKKPSHFGRNF